MPPDSMSAAEMVVLVLLAVFSAVCMLFVYALSHVSFAKLSKVNGKHEAQAKRILASEERHGVYSAGAVWWMVLASCAMVVLLCKSTVLPWELFGNTSLNPVWGAWLSVIVWVVVFSVFYLLICVLIPCRIAKSSPEKALLKVAPFMRVCVWLAYPVARALHAVAFFKQARQSDTQEDEDDNQTEEEIMFLVDAGGEDGSIEKSERDMIENIFEFDDRTAGEVMTHRTEVTALPQDASLAEVLEVATKQGYSRIPVYEEDIDNIQGVLYVKDLLTLIDHPVENFSLKDYIRPALFVPESNRCRELFNEFREKKLQLAIVVDEYGGTFGIVTMEDLLESIVGNIQDEYDNEEEQTIQKVNDDLYYIDGAASLDEVSKLLRVDFEENASYDTLAGLVTDLLGRIPDDHEHAQVTYGQLRMTVLEVEDRRINLIKVERLHPEETPEASAHSTPDEEKQK